MNYRLKLLIFLVCALSLLFVFNVGYSAVDTFSRLNRVESARDQWQRPSEVLQALNLRPGAVVADVGCGSGYFTLKLSSDVGSNGRVIAEDIRTLPLVFLWFRAALKRNVTLIRGEPNDPHLQMPVNAVLIANTYHEFADAQSILAHLSQSLVPGGRLVVVDRAPKKDGVDADASADHKISAERVENELRQARFEIVDRQDHFTEDPDRENWWLIVARRI